MNIRFNYLYRDAGNYKTYGAITFEGSNRYSMSELDALLEQALIEGEYFVAQDVGVPDLRPTVPDEAMDHRWHEMEGLDECHDSPDDEFGRTIEEFLEAMTTSRGSP